MGKRTSYEPGTFSWVDLATTDPDAAKAFYSGLFGWEAEDMPVPDAPPYSMMSLDGENVAAIYAQSEDQRSSGMPPAWFNYVTVASADDTAAAVREAGGSVHAEPFDVMTAGRMAVLADPAGAHFVAWEPRGHIGAARVNDPGCLTFNELSTNDVAAAMRFYEQLFGWKIDPIDTAGGPPYWMIGHHGAAEGRNGGVRELSPEQLEAGAVPHWMPYFTSTSVDETIAAAKEGGGALAFGPLDVPTGVRIAVLTDPQGAYFASFQGEVDD